MSEDVERACQATTQHPKRRSGVTTRVMRLARPSLGAHHALTPGVKDFSDRVSKLHRDEDATRACRRSQARLVAQREHGTSNGAHGAKEDSKAHAGYSKNYSRSADDHRCWYQQTFNRVHHLPPIVAGPVGSSVASAPRATEPHSRSIQCCRPHAQARGPRALSDAWRPVVRSWGQREPRYGR